MTGILKNMLIVSIVALLFGCGNPIQHEPYKLQVIGADVKEISMEWDDSTITILPFELYALRDTVVLYGLPEELIPVQDTVIFTQCTIYHHDNKMNPNTGLEIRKNGSILIGVWLGYGCYFNNPGGLTWTRF